MRTSSSLPRFGMEQNKLHDYYYYCHRQGYLTMHFLQNISYEWETYDCKFVQAFHKGVSMQHTGHFLLLVFSRKGVPENCTNVSHLTSL